MSVSLYWIPLGAGAHVVRVSGRVYEQVCAWKARRPACDLYHSALVVTTDEGPYIVEVGPVTDAYGRPRRGVVAEGAVGARWAGALRMFRYEVRCWRHGQIPDLAAAVDSPVVVAEDESAALRVLDLVPRVPTPVWGRDELRAGDMWNSNSVVSWLLASAGLLREAGAPPPNGRAPGWDAGVVAAQRGTAGSRVSPRR